LAQRQRWALGRMVLGGHRQVVLVRPADTTLVLRRSQGSDVGWLSGTAHSLLLGMLLDRGAFRFLARELLEPGDDHVAVERVNLH
jgi:hypothetical protein